MAADWAQVKVGLGEVFSAFHCLQCEPVKIRMYSLSLDRIPEHDLRPVSLSFGRLKHRRVHRCVFVRLAFNGLSQVLGAVADPRQALQMTLSVNPFGFSSGPKQACNIRQALLFGFLCERPVLLVGLAFSRKSFRQVVNRVLGITALISEFRVSRTDWQPDEPMP